MFFYGNSRLNVRKNGLFSFCIAIEKQTSSIENASANGETGAHTGLQSVFSIQTNGTDSDYDFIITSKILTDGGEVSAYGNNGSLLFGNTLAAPTQAAIDDAKAGGSRNKNVIAYPVTTVITNPMTVGFEQNYGIYGDCYVVKVNNRRKFHSFVQIQLS